MTTLIEDRAQWVSLVEAARRGDATAWPGLIERFENLAVASAVGLSGDLDDAREIAHEAFVLASRHITALEDAAAFPAWLLRLVRTAVSRRTRRRRPDTVPLDSGAAAVADTETGPDERAVAMTEAAEIRAAVEQLPEHERCVVALHYLAEMSYADVAAFLDISVSAAKKRAWSARSRLKELLPMVTDALAAARPSGDDAFRDTVLVFQAIRTCDADALARLLERSPSLANASEDWSPEEGFASRLGFSERATALVRAAGTGDLRLVRLLVDAGAAVDEVCGCVDQESALVAAVNIGAGDVVDYLLEQGAPVDGPAFDGASTALHVAVHREHHDLVRRLLAAGATPEATDAHGRTAADWATLKARRSSADDAGPVLWTRVRAVDLLSPLRPGALVHVPPAYGLGVMRLVYGLVDAFAPAEHWMIGFEHGPYEPGEFELGARESATPATIDLIAPGAPDRRRTAFAASLERLVAAPGRKVVMAVPAPGHEHDVTVALPGLAADPNVAVTVVVAPYDAAPPPVPPELPEGFDARITFDHARAWARRWPAIDPGRTSVRSYPDERHAEIAAAARRVLVDYGAVDPAFALPSPDTLPDTAAARRAQELVNYLTQSIRPLEMLSASPAPDTPFAALLDDVESILGS